MLLAGAVTAVLSVCDGSRPITNGTCFKAHDEMKIVNGIATQDACCKLCASTTGCGVFTYRDTACHLRETWEQSIPQPGPCNTGTLSGAPVPAPVPTPGAATTVTVDAANVTHAVRAGMRGCHTDLGYDHQIYGFYAQRLYGESFENYTLPVAGPKAAESGGATGDGNMWGTSGDGSFALVEDGTAFHGAAYQRVALNCAGCAAATVDNRGFNREGLSLRPGRHYEGYFYARSAAPASLLISLQAFFGAGTAPAPAEHAAPAQLVASEVELPGGGNWSRVDFNLTVPAGAAVAPCRSFPAETQPLACHVACKGAARCAHACVQCPGQLAIALVAGAAVDLDYAVLMPGEWGRYAGLPVLRESVEALQRAGYESIRTGGTYVETNKDEDVPKVAGAGAGAAAAAAGGSNAHGYLWKKMRGPRELRGVERTYGGASYGEPTTLGFGIFESMDMAEAMGVAPIITLGSTETAADLSDLVDYLFADASSNAGGSEWGALRAADGHPTPYEIEWFELGNEIVTPDFAAKAAAMEARAAANGRGGRLKYACPQNTGTDVMNSAAARKLGPQLYVDIHDHAISLGGVESVAAAFAASNVSARAVVWETNTRLHDFTRVLAEALDLNQLHAAAAPGGAAAILDSRVESFCMEKSGHDPGLQKGNSFLGDQGAVFFLPNMTYAQPPFYVHTMVRDTWQPNAVRTTVTATATGASSSSSGDVAVSDDAAAAQMISAFAAVGAGAATNVTVRLVNSGSAPANTTVLLRGMACAAPAGTLYTLSSGGDLTADNPPYDPLRFSPVRSIASFTQVGAGGGELGCYLELPAASFTVLVATC